MESIGFLTIIIFILIILPGLLSRRFYYSGEFTKQFKNKEWAYSLTTSSFIGILMHWLFYKLIIIKNCFPKTSEFFNDNFIYQHNYEKFIEELIKFIIHGSEKSDTLYSVYNILLLNTLYYLLFLCLFSIIITWIFQKIIKSLNIDARHKLFRYENYWYYYLRGEIGHFKEYKDIPTRRLKYTIAHVLAKETDEKNKLYEGVVSQYMINSKTLDLEYIYLTKVAKWSHTDYKFSKIPESDCFCIKNNQIVNLSFKYEFEDKKRHRVLEGFIVFAVLFIVFFLKINPSDKYYWAEIIVSKIFYSISFLFLITNYIEFKNIFKKVKFKKIVAKSDKSLDTKKRLRYRAHEQIHSSFDGVIISQLFVFWFLLIALLFSYRKELTDFFPIWIEILAFFPIILLLIRIFIFKRKS
jgi:hypothetical protein